MDITITLGKGAIVLRAKDDTYLSARSYLAGAVPDKDSRYEMQADERATHERKLLSGIGSAVSLMKGELNRWRISDTLTEGKDGFEITFSVSDRTDLSKKEDLRRLSEDFIYKRITAEWWAVNYPDAAPAYLNASVLALDELKKCLSLLPPYEWVGGVKYRCLCHRGFKVVLIYKEELMNEIHTTLLRLSKVRENEKGLPDLHLQTDEMGDESLMTRYVNRYVHRAGERMSAYLHELNETVDNDTMERVPVYAFRLSMPRGWEENLFEQLAEEIHAYVVNSCLYEWLKTYLPNLAPVYQQEAEVAYGNIKHVVTARKSHVIRKPIQPF